MDNIRQIQLKCLEILDIAHRICVENGIQYSLCGGSVVGAHLYKGCLPWDDDIDIMMTRDNYDKFLSIAPSLLPEGFSILNYHVSNDITKGLSKIVNEKTTYVEDNGNVLGVFLDITVYDRVPTNRLLRRIDLFLCARSLTALRGKMEGHGLKKWLRDLFIDLFLADKRRFFLFFEKVVVTFGRHTKSYTYLELFGAWAQTISYQPSVFENYDTIEFEGKQYMIVHDYIEYLQTRYNRTDFREPKEKQVPPHLVFFDSNLPYKEYLKRNVEKGNM